MKFAATILGQFSRGHSEEDEVFETRLRMLAEPVETGHSRTQSETPSLFRHSARKAA